MASSTSGAATSSPLRRTRSARRRSRPASPPSEARRGHRHPLQPGREQDAARGSRHPLLRLFRLARAEARFRGRQLAPGRRSAHDRLLEELEPLHGGNQSATAQKNGGGRGLLPGRGSPAADDRRVLGHELPAGGQASLQAGSGRTEQGERRRLRARRPAPRRPFQPRRRRGDLLGCTAGRARRTDAPRWDQLHRLGRRPRLQIRIRGARRRSRSR